MSQLFTVEGLEGASKSTSIATITETFQEEGVSTANVRMPGGTPLAEQIRELHKADWEEIVSPVSELLMMFTSHCQLYMNVIRPTLRDRDAVIADRNWHSTYAYQVFGKDNATRQLFEDLCDSTIGDLRHTPMLWLDVEPIVGLERARGRGKLDRIEQRDISFFENAQKAYASLYKRDPINIHRIDANRNIEQVQADVKEWAKRQAAIILLSK